MRHLLHSARCCVEIPTSVQLRLAHRGFVLCLNLNRLAPEKDWCQGQEDWSQNDQDQSSANSVERGRMTRSLTSVPNFMLVVSQPTAITLSSGSLRYLGLRIQLLGSGYLVIYRLHYVGFLSIIANANDKRRLPTWPSSLKAMPAISIRLGPSVISGMTTPLARNFRAPRPLPFSFYVSQKRYFVLPRPSKV